MNNVKEDKRVKLGGTTTPLIEKGAYANAIRITATDSEVIFDFAFIHPTDDKKETIDVISKIVLNPDFAKRIPQYIEKAIKEKNKK